MTEEIHAHFDTSYLTPEDIDFIRAHLEDAHAYYAQLLRGITEENFEERFDLGVCAGYFAAAEYHWIDMYPDMVRILHTGVDMFDYFSDFFTECMASILYHVYNGDPQPLVDLTMEISADRDAKNNAIRALARLYADGVLPQALLEQTIERSYLAHIEAQEYPFDLPYLIVACQFTRLRYLIPMSVEAGIWDRSYEPPEEVLNGPMSSLDQVIEIEDWICLEEGLSYEVYREPTQEQKIACWKAQRERLATYLPAGAKLTPREGP